MLNSLFALFPFLFSSPAFAQAAPAAQPNSIEMFLPFIFMIAIFYFLVIRPQGKRQKQHAKFLEELKRGDAVVTSTGIFGRIEGIADKAVTLEIADGVRIKILKAQVASSQAAFETASAKK